MPKGAYWTAEQIRFLEDHAHMPAPWIGVRVNRTPAQVRMQKKYRKLTRRKRFRTPDTDAELRRHYDAGLSDAAVAERANSSDDAVRRWRQRVGLPANGMGDESMRGREAKRLATLAQKKAASVGDRRYGHDSRLRLTAEQSRLAAREDLVAAVRAVAAFFASRRPKLADEFESAAMWSLLATARRWHGGLGCTVEAATVSSAKFACRTVIADFAPCGYRRTVAKQLAAPAVFSVTNASGDGDDFDCAEPDGGGPECEYADLVLTAARLLPGDVGVVFRLRHGVAGMDAKRIGRRLGAKASRVLDLLEQANGLLRTHPRFLAMIGRNPAPITAKHPEAVCP